jgi:hypothetical protein
VTVPVTFPEPTVKVLALLVAPPTDTTTGPAPAAVPVGTGTVILLALHRVGVATTPLNVTVLPGKKLKLAPEIVTTVPTGPEIGSNSWIEGLERRTFWDVVPPELTATEYSVVVTKPAAETAREYEPGGRLRSEYVPSAALVVDACSVLPR